MSSNRRCFSLSCQFFHRRSLTFNRLLWNDAQIVFSLATCGPSHRYSILESFASEIIEASDLLFETWGVLDVQSWHCWYVGLSDTKSEILSRLTFRHFLMSVLFHDQFRLILRTFVAAIACLVIKGRLIELQVVGLDSVLRQASLVLDFIRLYVYNHVGATRFVEFCLKFLSHQWSFLIILIRLDCE